MNYSQIRKMDISNGEGIRTSIFVSGCTLHCKGCFNKEAWDFASGKPFTSTEYFKILEQLKSPYCNGLSILGGEPFDQTDNYMLIELCKAAHLEGKDIWIWSGHSFEELNMNVKTKDLLDQCDYLVDGQFIEEQKDLTLKWRGSQNQRIIDLNKTREEERICLYE